MIKKKIYFAGAGGIGMAALERYFLSKGCVWPAMTAHPPTSPVP